MLKRSILAILPVALIVAACLGSIHFLTGPDDLLESRSPDWPRIRAAHLLIEWECQACGKNTDLEVHHVIPVSWDARKECDPENLITLCRRCHLFVGHLTDTQSYNPHAREDARAWREKIRKRPKRD